MSRFLQQALCNQKLFNAASSGKLPAVQEQHLQGGHINCQSFQGITPLKVAVGCGNAKVGDTFLIDVLANKIYTEPN